MAVKIIIGYNDAEWSQYEKLFYNNFIPDDWDYIVIGESRDEVESIAYQLEICDKTIKQIDGIWYAVTYHA